MLVLLGIFTLLLAANPLIDEYVPENQFEGSVLCELCEYGIGWIEDNLEDNVSELQQLVNNTICPRVADSERVYCYLFVADYIPEIVSLLENKETPNVICQQLKLCSSDNEMCPSHEMEFSETVL